MKCRTHTHATTSVRGVLCAFNVLLRQSDRQFVCSGCLFHVTAPYILQFFVTVVRSLK